nr:lipoate--protein ligase family protein [Bacillus sp. FJAT-45350]
MNSLLQQPWRFIDHTTFGFDALHSFAYDDTLCSSVGELKSEPVLRSWVHHQTVVLGIQDSRLPFVQDGINFLQSAGYKVIVRNSGGLAVVLDDGILNLSLILKEEKKLSINHGYELMFELIQALLSEENVTIEAREIVGSYCPGSFDLSIDGKKFAGISQRRIRGGVAVQIYLCVKNSGSQRAELIKEFYEKSVQEQPTKFEYPRIKPETMASLSTLVGKYYTISSIMHQLLITMTNQKCTLMPSSLTPEEIDLFQYQLQRITNRNEKALEF